jgi:hypothetical protein
MPLRDLPTQVAAFTGGIIFFLVRSTHLPMPLNNHGCLLNNLLILTSIFGSFLSQNYV